MSISIPSPLRRMLIGCWGILVDWLVEGASTGIGNINH
ncbi:hypothetical protein V6Z12_D06G199900 [Gossypium hirsutum]